MRPTYAELSVRVRARYLRPVQRNKITVTFTTGIYNVVIMQYRGYSQYNLHILNYCVNL